MYLKEVYINEDAWHDVKMHAIEGGLNETGGYLLGFRCMLEKHPVTWITKSLRGKCISSRANVVIDASTYECVPKEIETNDLYIMGWYHTHPGFGVFLSGVDMNTMFLHFDDMFSIALVLDPMKMEHGFFGWKKDGSKLDHLNAYLFYGNNYEEYFA